MAWAARLIERHVDERFLRGEGATLARWLAALPADLVRPVHGFAWHRRSSRSQKATWKAAGPLLDAAERAFAHAADEPFEPSAGKASSFLVNVPAAIALERAVLAHLCGDGQGTAVFASRALAETVEGE